MHLNMAKGSPGDKITILESDTGQMLLSIKGAETVARSPGWGWWDRTQLCLWVGRRT